MSATEPDDEVPEPSLPSPDSDAETWVRQMSLFDTDPTLKNQTFFRLAQRINSAHCPIREAPRYRGQTKSRQSDIINIPKSVNTECQTSSWHYSLPVFDYFLLSECSPDASS